MRKLLSLIQAANLQCIPAPWDSRLECLLEAPVKVACGHVLPHKELLVRVGLNVGPGIEKKYTKFISGSPTIGQFFSN